jgi:hypothetical protein
MNRTPTNPFTITRAADFSDQQINDYWVDYPDGGLVALANPTSSMPMLILGGKGSGKTHLMRYFSYSLQKIRHLGDVERGLQQEGYLGIYLRCGGLNGSRFRHKGQGDDTWSTIFAYYMEIWLAQLVLDTVRDAFASLSDTVQTDICEGIISLLDVEASPRFASLQDASAFFKSRQRKLDYEINNCAIKKTLDLKIESSPGKLVFGIPKIITQCVPALEGCTFLYLVDELENLLEYQQRYVNTLVREQENPSTLKIGTKLYGVRTLRTNSADEENREGSEYEALRLDARMRTLSHYNLFAKRLVVRRLVEHGYATASTGAKAEDSLQQWFEEPAKDREARSLTAFIAKKYENQERPYFRALRRKLEVGARSDRAPGVRGKEAIDKLISNLTWPDIPLYEKVNCYLLYKEWATSLDLLKESQEIARNLVGFMADSQHDGRHKEALSKFKADLIAQMMKECDQKQLYSGIDTFIKMSMGFPRNLLIILKNIYSWSVFNGGSPFLSMPISLDDQSAGVKDAVDWFYRDSQSSGSEKNALKDSVNRLGTLFRRIRFSDKPSECSLSTFSCNLAGAKDEARQMIELAQQWSLLIDVGNQRDRNEGRLDIKLQLNPMLAPRWDLSIYQRGVIALNTAEVNAIFAPSTEEEFNGILKVRIDRMEAPFFGESAKSSTEAAFLPGFEVVGSDDTEDLGDFDA